MIRSVGILGVGMVGGATKRFFESVGNKPFVYDKDKSEGSLEEVNRAEVVFVCVPTPYDQDRGGFDLSAVRECLRGLNGEKIVVIKSTVLPGTTETLQKEFPQHRLMMNPEFLTQITADQDMQYPDRQIVGYTERSYTAAGDIMAILPRAPFERIVPASAAEMIKYFGNTWFSTKVTFANQMYNLCQKSGVDYDLVKEAVAADKRIGWSHLEVFHKGYRGYGGVCLPKDTRALIQFGDKMGVELALLKKVDELNNALHRLQGLEPPA